MLNQLVDLLQTKENGLSLSEISRAMKVQPSALLAMIELLVRKGKLVEVGPDDQCCTTCGLQSDCNLLAARGKRYVVNRTPGIDANRISLESVHLTASR